MGKVLLTRPIFDALETSDILKRYNIQSLCTPLIEIKKVPYEILSFSEYDIFLFNSKNAVRNFRINKKELVTNKLFLQSDIKQKICY